MGISCSTRRSRTGRERAESANVCFRPIADITRARHSMTMRTALFPLLLAFAVGSSGCERAPKVDRVEMRLSGWSGVDIAVDSQGKGEYRLSDYPHQKGGSFSITPEQFNRLVQRIEPFRRQAVPFTDKSAREFIDQKCPKGVPFTTDAGAVWLHWVGPSSDQHYLADLGCDADRNAVRNKELLSIVKSLPVPLN